MVEGSQLPRIVCSPLPVQPHTFTDSKQIIISGKFLGVGTVAQCQSTWLGRYKVLSLIPRAQKKKKSYLFMLTRRLGKPIHRIC